MLHFVKSFLLENKFGSQGIIISIDLSRIVRIHIEVWFSFKIKIDIDVDIFVFAWNCEFPNDANGFTID